MKPAVRIDNFKLEFCLLDAFSKIEFLGKISESEDNSSELAGFEINKLMREQSHLEKQYAQLITQRSSLKGIANREERKKVEEDIATVSKSLKENTKKLCRLFKPNTNLDNDSEKVREERIQLMDILVKLLDDMKGGTTDRFIGDLNMELDEQNRLAEYLAIEKDLSTKIKNLKGQIAEEAKEFEDLRKEKKSTIHNLKNEVTKAMTESHAKLRYERKVSETKVATHKRINAQKLKEVQKTKDDIIDLQKREDAVADKLNVYLKDEQVYNDKLNKEFNEASEKLRTQIKREQFELDIEIRRNTEIIEKFKAGIETEKKLKEQEENRIKSIMKAKEDEEKKNQIIDEKMKIIQNQFEEWMRLVGPKTKPKPAGGKGGKGK